MLASQTCIPGRLMIVLVAVSVTSGCRQPKTAPAGPMTAGTETLSANDLLPLTERSVSLLLTRNDEPPTTIERTMRRDEAFGGQWREETGKGSIRHLRALGDGSVAMVASIERSDGALSFFDPPLVIVPATLEPRTSFESEAGMRIVSDTDPDNQREKGTASQRLIYVGDETISTATGRVAARRIESTFLADLTFADAETTSVLWLDRDMAPIREERVLSVRIMGFPPRSTRTMLEWVDR